MIISHRHKFIFVHLHKCAGTSVTRALIPYLGRNDLVFGCTPKYERISKQSRNSGGPHKHSTAKEIREYVGDERWHEYLKFSFVRNPWDLVLSKYFWWHKTPGDWSETSSATKKRIMEMPFSEYAKNYGKNQSFYKSMVSSANASEIDLDFVGRYETLDADFEKLCQELHFPAISLLSLNTSSEMREKPSYVDYYDEESREVIAKVYAKEIENFGYQFGA